MSRSPRWRKRFVTAVSWSGSFGLWMRFTPKGRPGISVWSRFSAPSTRSKDKPAAPKKPSIPPRAIASTSSTDAMPLAIAPAT